MQRLPRARGRIPSGRDTTRARDFRDEVGGGGAGLFHRSKFADFDFVGEGVEGGLHRLVVVGGADQRHGHSHVADGAVLGGEQQRGAQCGAIVTGGGLYVEVVE